MKFIITVHVMCRQDIKILVKYVLKSAWKLFMMIIITVMTEFFEEFYVCVQTNDGDEELTLIHVPHGALKPLNMVTFASDLFFSGNDNRNKWLKVFIFRLMSVWLNKYNNNTSWLEWLQTKKNSAFITLLQIHCCRPWLNVRLFLFRIIQVVLTCSK